MALAPFLLSRGGCASGLGEKHGSVGPLFFTVFNKQTKKILSKSGLHLKGYIVADRTTGHLLRFSHCVAATATHLLSSVWLIVHLLRFSHCGEPYVEVLLHNT